MDYLVQNATEIMQLCIGGGILLVSLALVRFLWIVSQTIKKIYDLVELVNEFVIGPIKILKKVQKYISSLGEWIGE